MQKLLIVEDDRGLSLLFRKRLEMAGYHVITASNGVEALEYLDQHTVHLMTIDLQMPFVMGNEVIRRVREQAQHATMKIIIITASAEWRKMPHIGLADSVLIKPVNISDLLQAVQSTLSDVITPE